jgi:hypothetical protein
MNLVELILWIVSFVLFGLATFQPRPFNILAGGLLAMDLWLGLTYLWTVTKPITF